MVTISLVPRRERTYAGIRIQTAPASEPNNNTVGIITNDGRRSPSARPAHAPPIMPKYNWPSPPMLYKFIWNANAAEIPVQMRTVERPNVSVMPREEVKPSLNMLEYVSMGEYPVASRNNPPAASAAMTEISGTSVDKYFGVSLRCSKTIRIGERIMHFLLWRVRPLQRPLLPVVRFRQEFHERCCLGTEPRFGRTMTSLHQDLQR